MTRRYLPAGTDALLVELADLAHTLDLLAALQAAPPPGVTECVPAARTLLVRFDPRHISAPTLRAAIEALKTGQRTDTPGARIEIPVRYDGADLAELAALLGITAAELIARHTGQAEDVHQPAQQQRAGPAERGEGEVADDVVRAVVLVEAGDLEKGHGLPWVTGGRRCASGAG